MKKNTFYELKDYSPEDHTCKYIRVDDIIGKAIYHTEFTENFVEFKKVRCGLDEKDWTELPKNLQTLCVGDILTDNEDNYCKVLGVINQNCYIMSLDDEDINSSDLGIIDDELWTVRALERNNYKPYTTQPTDDTIEIEGTKYKASEVREALKQFKK